MAFLGNSSGIRRRWRLRQGEVVRLFGLLLWAWAGLAVAQQRLAAPFISGTAINQQGETAWVERRTETLEGTAQYVWILRTREKVWAATDSEPFQLDFRENGLWFAADTSAGRKIFHVAEPGAEVTAIAGSPGLTRFRIAPDGRRVAWLEVIEAAGRNLTKAGAALNALRLDRAGHSRRIGDQVYAPSELAWSPDSTHVALRAHSGKDELVEVRLSDGRVRGLTKGSRDAMPLYSPDGRYLAFQRSGYRGGDPGAAAIFVMEVMNRRERMLGTTPNQGPTPLAWAADGSRVYAIDRRGISQRIYEFPLKGRLRTLYKPERGTIHSEAYAGGRFAFVGEAPERAPQVWEWDDAGDPRPLSATPPAIESTCRTTLWAWKADDGTPVQGLLSLPQGKPEARPLIVLLHGGPAGVFAASFDGGDPLFPVSSFCQEGYAVLRPNQRGSNGYGAAFRNALYGDLGGKDASDVEAGIRQLVEQGTADPRRVGAAGWSYGGYLALRLAARPGLLRSAVAGAAMTDLAALHESTILPGLVELYLGGPPSRLEKQYRSRSPVKQAPEIQLPVLLLHGALDQQVPVAQAMLMKKALDGAGAEVALRVLDQMAHEPATAPDALEVHRALVEWFGRTLPAAPVAD